MNKSCYDYALAHISRFPKTTEQLRRFLIRKEYVPDKVEETLQRLTSVGMIDDRVYTRLFLNSEVCRNGKPIYIVEQKLIMKGVDKTIIAEEKAPLEQEIEAGMREKIIRLVDSQRNRGRESMKIIHNITQKGYPYGLVKEIVNG